MPSSVIERSRPNRRPCRPCLGLASIGGVVSFVPVTGPATFRAADPPREGVVEFTDERRTVTPADPGGAAGADQGAQPRRPAPERRAAVGGGAAGRCGWSRRASSRRRPATGTGTPSWRISGARRGRRGPDRDARARAAARRRAGGARPDRRGRRRDAAQPPAEAPARRRRVAARRRGPTFEERLQARLAQHRRVDPTDLPQLVRLSLRVEADEEELVAGAVRLVPQVHDEQNPLHLCDAGDAVDRRRRRARLRRPGAHPRHDRAARPRPTPGRCSTGCSSCGCPTRSRSTPTSWSACSTTGSARCASAGSTCCGRAAWAAT